MSRKNVDQEIIFLFDNSTIVHSYHLIRELWWSKRFDKNL